MTRILALYLVWLIAAGMLVAAVTEPPAINFGLTRSASGYSGHSFRSRSYSRSYYSQRRDFYTLLRWVCCAAFAYSALTAFQTKRVAWTSIFGILAVLFNPFAVVHLQRATWQIIDWAAIVVIVIGAILSWRDKGTLVANGDKFYAAAHRAGETQSELEKALSAQKRLYSGGLYFAQLPEAVAAAETDADGRFQIDVPDEGRFRSLRDARSDTKPNDTSGCNEEVIARLCSALADGMPIKGACVVAGIGASKLAD
jgi:hypothetical protein